jgi:hypothetical protein
MTATATASFVNTRHESAALGFGPQGCARVTLHRTYSGSLVGESQGELLVCPTAEGVFGYVGIDHFTGALDGRRGSFVYQHGEMHDQGSRRPFGFVVTGSGTGELAGLRGDLAISTSAEGAHQLTLDYAFET